jgi:hypothetical protein
MSSSILDSWTLPQHWCSPLYAQNRLHTKVGMQQTSYHTHLQQYAINLSFPPTPLSLWQSFQELQANLCLLVPQQVLKVHLVLFLLKNKMLLMKKLQKLTQNLIQLMLLVEPLSLHFPLSVNLICASLMEFHL